MRNDSAPIQMGRDGNSYSPFKYFTNTDPLSND